MLSILVEMSSKLTLQTLQHLSQAAKLVDSENRTQKLLHCYYLSRIQRIAEAENIPIEQSSCMACMKCLTPLNDSKSFSLSIKPRKIHKRKHKKLVSELECRNNLSESKRNFARKYQKLVYNVAETTCKLCNSKRKSIIRFDTKSKDKLKSEQPPDPPIVQLSELELIKSKKRKRDKYAGLIIKEKVPNSTSTFPAKPIVQPIKVQAKPKPNNTKKSKNSTNSVPKMKNISSAEKQRKSILLLANVLKMNDNRQQHSSDMKLNKMFRKKQQSTAVHFNPVVSVPQQSEKEKEKEKFNFF